MKFQFEVLFEAGNTHKCRVIVHKSRRALRRAEAPGSTADAFCWQYSYLRLDSLICEIHLAKDTVSVDDITHEAFHAVYHRARFLGLPVNGKLEEKLATDVGVLTNTIVAKLQQLNVKVKA